MAKLFLLGLGSTAVIGGGIGTGIYFGVGYGNSRSNEEGKGGETGAISETQEEQAGSASNTGSSK